METTYKVITETFSNVYIEHFSKLEKATKTYNEAIENGCERCYLLETEIKHELSGDSFNKIMSSYFRKK